jgi:hypothetical protein
MQMKKLQRASKTTTGRVFCSSDNTPGLPFTVVLRNNSSSLSCLACPATVVEMSPPPPLSMETQSASSMSVSSGS